MWKGQGERRRSSKARADGDHWVPGMKNFRADAWHRSPVLREGGKGREDTRLTNFSQWLILLDLTLDNMGSSSDTEGSW